MALRMAPPRSPGSRTMVMPNAEPCRAGFTQRGRPSFCCISGSVSAAPILLKASLLKA